MSRRATLDPVEPRRLLSAAGESEPNDTLATADVAELGDCFGAGITPADDLDLFRITFEQGQSVRVQLETPVPRDKSLNLFSADGQSLGGTSGNAAVLDLTLSSAGTYFLGVTGGDNQYDPADGSGVASGASGFYELNFVDLTPTGGDDDDDTTAEAAPLALGETIQSQINPNTDVDLYEIAVDAGQRVSVDTDTPFGGNLSTLVRLFDVNGDEIARNDDDRGHLDPQVLDGYLEYEFDASGTYYIGVSGDGNGAYDPVGGGGDQPGFGGVGDYSIALFPGDANDQIAEAASTFPGSTIRGDLSVAGDVDLYEFTTFDGDYHVNADFTTFDGSPEPFVRLFDAGGNVLASGLAEITSPLLFDREPYYLGLSAADNTTYDPLTGDGDSGDTTLSYLGSLQFTSGPGGGEPVLLDAFYAVDDDLIDDADGPAVIFDFDRDVEEPDDVDVMLVDTNTGDAVDPGDLNFEILDGPQGDDTRLAVVFDDGPLPDGDYRLTLPPGTVLADDGDVPLDEAVSAEFFVMAGDFNRDRRVNLADFTVLASNFGGEGVFTRGDANYDGVVNLADFTILAGRFGTTLADDDS